jgi:hypothetical protein
MRPRRTGLPVNIYLDNAFSYEQSNHPLWMYFQNDYGDVSNTNENLLPISIDKSPKLLVNPAMVKIDQSDLNKIIEFVKLNAETLTRFANQTIDDDTFYEKIDISLHKLNESNRILLTEMAKTVDPSLTGLTVPIWLDESGQYLSGGHGPRIKFQAIRGEKKMTRSNFGSISISDNPEVMEMPKNADISSKEIELIKKFIIYNKDLLLNLINNKIDFDTEFKPNMIRLDNNGNPIYPTKNEKTFNYGFRLVKSKNGTYNFTDQNDNLITPERWYTKAFYFKKYDNGNIAASVMTSGKWYWLYQNGVLVEQ